MTDRLPLDLPEKASRRRTRRGVAVGPRAHRRTDHELLRAPQVVVCGFCGTTGTVFGQAASCQRCGALLMRD